MGELEREAEDRVRRLDALAHHIASTLGEAQLELSSHAGRTFRRTWSSPGIVVTVLDATAVGSEGDPPAEAAVAQALAGAGVAVPGCIQSGYLDGDGYAVWERVPGRCLRADDLAEEPVAAQYLRTVTEVAQAVGASGAAAVARRDPWSPAGVTDEAVELLVPLVGDEVRAVLPAARALDWSTCHGDLHPGNVIWDGATMRVVDFEHVGKAPGATSDEAERAFVAYWAVRHGLDLGLPGQDPARGASDARVLAVAAHAVSRVGTGLLTGATTSSVELPLRWLRTFVGAGC